jgi:nucleoside-diphosphate-sugar epimerase
VRVTKRIFVTGATGAVGRLVAPQLIQLGHSVTAVGRTPEKRKALEDMGARATTLDMYERDAARRAFEGFDTLINLATHIPDSTFRMMFRRSWRENDRIRSEGSATLVEAARDAGVERFIQESFAPMYESHGANWIDETWRVRPVACNRSTLDAEASAQRFTSRGGTGVVLRFSVFYGPDAVLGDMINTVRRGWSPLPGRADAYASSCAHEDAAAAVVAALGIPPGIYNVCDDQPLTRREWIDALAAAAHAKSPKLLPAALSKFGGLMELFSRSQRISNGKLKSVSPWRPKWASARTGLMDAVERRVG